MFRNNMIVALKSNGKFFRENEDSVNIPFGTEYSIYIKNQNNTDALVSVSIDGKDVLSGSKIIVRSKSVLDLEGYLDGNMVKNKFRFIERTKPIEDFRGIKPDDGIISVVFDYEKRKPNYEPYKIYYPKWENVPYTITTTNGNTGDKPSSLWGKTISGGGSWYTADNSNYFYQATYTSTDVTENGITVRGGDTYQNFGYSYLGEMENDPRTISFKLVGSKDKNVFVSDLITCETCGKKNKNSKFCPQCGTRLIQ